MNNKIKKLKEMMKSLSYLDSLLNEYPDFYLFICGTKPAFMFSAKTNREIRTRTTLFLFLCNYIFVDKLYARIIRTKNNYWALISKEDFTKELNYLLGNKNFRKTNKVLGGMLGYPKCCVQAYARENRDSGSFNSVIRYKKQCANLNLQDIFNVSLNDKNTGYLGFGFVPCNPECPKALAIYKEFQQIKRHIGR